MDAAQQEKFDRTSLKQKPEQENEVLYAEGITLTAFLTWIGIVYIAGAIVIYWRHTENDRRELFRITGNWFNQATSRTGEVIAQVTEGIFNGLRQNLSLYRGFIDAHSESIRNFIRQRVSEIFESQSQKLPQTAPATEPSPQTNATTQLPPSQAMPSEVVQSPPPATLPPSQQQSNTTQQEQLAAPQQQINNIEPERDRQRYQQQVNATNAAVELDRQRYQQQVNATNAAARLDAIRMDHQARVEQIETNRANAQNQIQQNGYNQFWRLRLRGLPADQQQAIIRDAAIRYQQIHRGETIDLRNPNPSDAPLFSDLVGEIAINRESASARQQATSRIEAVPPPPSLGGFGEGVRPEVPPHTGHPRQAPLPPLGGFGAGSQPEVPTHTGNSQRETGIPQRLGGFGEGPQPVGVVFHSSSDTPSPSLQPDRPNPAGIFHPAPRPLTDQEALSHAVRVRNRPRISSSDLRGALSNSAGQAGHATGKHRFPENLQADIINNPEHVFIGINDNGRQVTVFYKDGDVVITQDNDFTRVITAYGRSGVSTKPGGRVGPGSPVTPDRWANNPNYVEIK